MDERIQTLIRWATENNSQISDTLEFGYSEDRGVYAVSKIDQDEPSKTPQLSIPLEMIIRNELAESHFGVTSEKCLNVNGLLKLFVAKLKYGDEPVILEEKNLTEFFSPYIELLPVGRETNSPFYYSSQEVLLLQHTNLGGSLQLKLKSILNEWKSAIEIAGAADDAVQSYHDKFDTFSWENVVQSLLEVNGWKSFAAYLWSSIIFTSRAFPHHIIDSNSKDGQAVLLPLIDLLNHDNSTNVQWGFHDGSFTLHNNEKLSKGQEVTNNYGAKGNEELLMGYGFVIPGNKNDSVALRVKLGQEVIAKAKEFGVSLPKMSDYTHHAFLTNEQSSEETINDDGLLYFLNKWSLVPENLLHLFTFLVKAPQETKRTVRSDLAALQNLRRALEQKQNLLKQDIEGIDKVVINPQVFNNIDTYRKGQISIYKQALAEIKAKEKTLLQDYKGKLLTLKKIYKRDERLATILESFGLDSYEQIEAQDYVDVVLFLWVILNSESPDEEYSPPEYLTTHYKTIQSSDFVDDGSFLPLYQSLASVLSDSPFETIVTPRNIAIASEVIRLNSYVRVSNNEIILVEPTELL